MKKLILGSGLIGLLAREILGPDWTLIPFGRSRFYSYNPPLADNFIVYSDAFSDIETLKNKSVIFHKRGFSLAGGLIFNNMPLVTTPWAAKLGMDPNKAQLSTLRTEFPAFDISCASLYKTLLRKYDVEIREGLKRGAVKKINKTDVVTDIGSVPYDKVVSTIPLEALALYAGLAGPRRPRQVYYYLIASPSVDLEGCTQVLVCDEELGFFKVNHMGGNLHMFFCHQKFPDPELFFSAFINQFQIVNATSIPDALPLGDSQTTVDQCKAMNITPVGDGAEDDYFMDVSSSINYLRKLRHG